ncbi:MAG: CNNM domain-containing protein [Chthoniobacterales bacterium]
MIWLAIAALCGVSFLFAGIEAGILSVDPVQLRQNVKQRVRGARRLTRLLEHPGRVLVTVLIITNVADIFALLLATRELVGLFGRLGYVVVLVAAAPIYLFVLGVLPKSLFRRFPFRALAALAGILETASFVLWPLIEVGERIGKVFLPRRGSDRARLFAAREELKQVAVQSEREGSLTATERAMIHNVVDFRNVRAGDVMMPLVGCVSLRPETPVAEVLALSKTSGAERFPVISADGQAVGIVNVLDILFDKTRAPALGKYVRRIVTASEDEPAYQILRRLRAARLGLAAVVDRDSKLIGIATGEDLVRRLVQST